MDKQLFNISTGIAAFAGGSLTIEKGYNGWLQIQRLTLQENDQKRQKQKLKMEQEAAAQQRAVDHSKWLISKSEESRKIYSAYNKKEITTEQKNQLLFDLNSAYSLKLTQNMGTTLQPVLVSLNKENIEQFYENENNYFAQQYYTQVENKDFNLTPLESYPFGWIIFSGFLGAIGGILAQKVFIYIFSLVETFWKKKD